MTRKSDDIREDATLAPGEGSPLLTRRELIGGIAKVATAGAVLATAASGLSLVGCGGSSSGTDLDILTVSEDAVVTLDAFTEIKKPKGYYSVSTLCKLNPGALIGSSDGRIASALCTGKTASPLSTIGLLDLSDGVFQTVLGQAVGHAEGFSLYDVRSGSSILVWVESNYLTSAWRVYVADLSGMSIGKPIKVDEGDAQYDAPEIAAVGSRAFWIVQPTQGGDKTTEDSTLKMSSGGETPAIAYTSHGRFNGGLQVSGDVVTAMPRAESSSSVYYQLTAFSGVSGTLVASQVMPSSFEPSAAIYMDGRFAFSISAGYNFGGGIANVGTYYPMGNDQWLRLTKAPVTAPGLCNGWLFSKSGARTVFVDMKGKRYFVVQPPGDSEDYGDYSIQLGEVDQVFNYAALSKTSGAKTSQSTEVRRIIPKQIS